MSFLILFISVDEGVEEYIGLLGDGKGNDCGDSHYMLPTGAAWWVVLNARKRGVAGHLLRKGGQRPRGSRSAPNCVGSLREVL